MMLERIDILECGMGFEAFENQVARENIPIHSGGAPLYQSGL